MTPKRRTALQLALLAVVMTAAATLFVAGPACTPVTPDRPASPPAAPDATAEPTATPTTATATATNTPTTAPPATASATITSTPTPTISPINSKLEPMLNALVIQHQASATPAAPGQIAGVRTVGVCIEIAWPSDSAGSTTRAAVDLLMTNNGGIIAGRDMATYLAPEIHAGAWTEFSRNACPVGVMYIVPVSLLPQLSAVPGVTLIIAARPPEDFPYPKMSRYLNNVVAAWQAGATPEQLATAVLMYDDMILTFIRVDDAAALRRVEGFFTANKVYVSPERRDSRSTKLQMMVLVPIPILGSLSQVSGVMEVSSFQFGLPPSAEISPDEQSYFNLYLYGALPPNLRSQLSPLPTEVWELEGITPTPTAITTPAPCSGRVGAAADAGDL